MTDNTETTESKQAESFRMTTPEHAAFAAVLVSLANTLLLVLLFSAEFNTGGTVSDPSAVGETVTWIIACAALYMFSPALGRGVEVVVGAVKARLAQGGGSA